MPPTQAVRQGQQPIVPFGAEDRADLIEIAGQIKTFTERVEDERALADMRRAVQEAEVIVFLGFSFGEMNMELLKPDKPSQAKRVYGTAFGISQSDIPVVESMVLETLGRKSENTTVALRNGLKCSDLFNEYWRSLSR